MKVSWTLRYRLLNGDVLHDTTATQAEIEHLFTQCWLRHHPCCVGSWYYQLVNVLIDRPAVGDEPSLATAIVADIDDEEA